MPLPKKDQPWKALERAQVRKAAQPTPREGKCLHLLQEMSASARAMGREEQAGYFAHNFDPISQVIDSTV